MKSFGRLFSRSRKNSGSNSRKAALTRRLRSEALERRQLLAGDILAHHNYLIAPDVNRDFEITPKDALGVINAINQYGTGPVDRIPVTENSLLVDTTGDNQLTPMDALWVINALNNGGEAQDEFVELRLDVREHIDNVIPGNPPIDSSLLAEGSRTLTVGVGDIVDLEISYEDLRRFGNDIGAFTIFADLFTPNEGVTFADFVEPIVTETQEIVLSSDFTKAEGGEFVFSMEGRTPFPVPTDDFLDDPIGEISNALRSFGFTQTADDGVTELDQFSVTRLPRDSSDSNAPFEYRIRFLGDALANEQIDNIDVDVSGVTSSQADFNFTSDVLEIPAINADNSVNSNAIRFNINTHSRTWQNNSHFYNLSTGGDFTAEGYDEVGGVGQILANGIPDFVEPFDAFSLPIRITQPIQDLVIQLDPPDTQAAAILLYPGGDGDAISSDMIRIDTTDDPAIAGDDRFGLVVFNAVEGSLVVNPGSITLNEDLDPPGGNTIDLSDLVEDISDPNATITIESVTNGSLGTVTLNGSFATYVPQADVSGSDSFTFTATNGPDTVTGTVNVTIDPINDPPTANNDAINATQDSERTIQANELLANDTAGPADEDQELTISAVTEITGTNPTLGDVSLNNDGTISYSPPDGFSGTDRFRYTVRDSDGATATAVVTVTVDEVNTPPNANPDTLTTEEDTDLTFTADELMDNDTDNGAISFVELNEDLDPATQGTITNNGGGSFTYNPPQDISGNALATFTYRITDGEFEDTATVTINVTPVNDDPVATDDNLSVDELTTSILDVLANDNPGPNESSQTITIVDIDTTETDGQATIVNNGQNIEFTPSELAPSQTTLSYTIADSQGATATATVTLNIVPVVRPRAVNDTRTIAEDSGVLTIDVLANDLANEGEQATLQGIGSVLEGDATVSINTNGTATQTDDTIRVDPAAEFFGAIRFTYTISDTGGVVNDADAATATVTVNVTPENDAPQFRPDQAVTTPEDEDRTIDGNQLLENDLPGPEGVDPPFDESDQTLRISAVNASSQRGGTVTLNANNQIVYSPPLNFNGNDVITYTIADGTGDDAETVQGTLTVTVTPVNDPPVPGTPNFDATEDEDLVLTQSQVLAGSTAGPATGTPENQTLSVTGSVGGTSEAGGSVDVASNGTVTYSPPAEFFGEDSFVLRIRDNGTPRETANLTVTVNVAAVNDAPVAGNDTVIAFQNSVATFTQAQLLDNDRPGPAGVSAPFDESDQTLTITAVRALAGTQGQVSLNANGTIRFEPTADFEGETTFEYTVSDGEKTDTAIVTVDVQEFQPSSISGSVFFDKIVSLTNPVRNGVQDSNEAGLSGVTVRLNSPANANVTGMAISRTTLTEVDGSYRFDALPPGTYTVNFDLPPHVLDGGDFAGSLGDADSESNQFTVEIAQPGGFDADNYRFTVLSFTGAAAETGDILAIDYLRENPDIADASNNGREGGTAALNADGQMTFFTAREGMSDARFIEVAVNEDQDEALLSYIDRATNTVLSARLTSNQFLLVPDGEGGVIMRIFGGLEDFSFADSAEGLLNQEFANYRDSIDQIMAEQA